MGTLGFYTFRRTMTIGMSAINMNKPLFTYRQVKPVDVVLVRTVSEIILMFVISIVILLGAALAGVDVWPDNFLTVFSALWSLALFAVAIGLLVSVANTLVTEVADIVGLSVLPLSMLSGVMFPVAAVPQSYRDWLLFNPIAHSLDTLRHGFASNYVTFPECSTVYPHVVAIVLFLFGLIVHKLYEKKVIAL